MFTAVDVDPLELTIYLTSGGTKLANPDWRGGLVLWDRVVRHAHRIPFGG